MIHYKLMLDKNRQLVQMDKLKGIKHMATQLRNHQTTGEKQIYTILILA